MNIDMRGFLRHVQNAKILSKHSVCFGRRDVVRFHLNDEYSNNEETTSSSREEDDKPK